MMLCDEGQRPGSRAMGPGSRAMGPGNRTMGAGSSAVGPGSRAMGTGHGVRQQGCGARPGARAGISCRWSVLRWELGSVPQSSSREEGSEGRAQETVQ